MPLKPIEFDGFTGFVAEPYRRDGPRPGILVLSDAGGLQELAKQTAQAFADKGYVALAGDYYGGGWTGVPPQIHERADEMVGDLPRFRSNVIANIDALKAQDGVDPARIAAVGFCLGGTAVLELARSGADVVAVVSYHGLLQTTAPAGPGEVKAKILVCTGADDPLVPLPRITDFQLEMSSAEADCQVIIYTGAAHSFMKPTADGSRPGIIYHECSARRAWSATLAHLNEAFNVR